MVINFIKLKIKLFLYKNIWRKKNKDNFTTIKNSFPLKVATVGKYTYGQLEIYCWDKEKEKLEIGNFVSIASGVKFLLGGNHYIDTVSTYPFKVMVCGEKKEAWSKGKIVVEDDVWIGMGAMVLSGVRVGKGSVIAAGSVVTKSIPPYSIVAGNPARIIKKRFSDKIIEKLMEIDYNNIDLEKVKENIDTIYSKVNEDNVDNIIKIIKK